MYEVTFTRKYVATEQEVIYYLERQPKDKQEAMETAEKIALEYLSDDMEIYSKTPQIFASATVDEI